jgi:molecular chaperone DnaK (HSP70)
LQDIIPYNLVIAVKNQNKNEDKELMFTIIKKNSKIPYNSDAFPFTITLNEKTKDINVNIYEGNDKYAEKNTKLGELKVENISKVGKIEYRLKFIIDVNGELTVQLTSDSLGINKEQSFRNITHAIVYNKKIKISKNKNIGYIGNMIKSISSSKLSIAKSYNNPEEKIKNLVECCQSYEELIESYKLFSANNESAYEKIFNYTLELFNLYVERIKLKDMNKDNIKKIIESVKEKMKNLISIIGYMEELLSVFLKIRESCKNECYFCIIIFYHIN